MDYDDLYVSTLSQRSSVDSNGSNISESVYPTSTEASDDKNGDGKLEQKGKQEDGNRAEF